MTKIALQAPDVTPGMDGRVGEKLFGISGWLWWAELCYVLCCKRVDDCGGQSSVIFV